MKALIIIAVASFVACTLGMAGAASHPTGIADSNPLKVVGKQINPAQDDSELTDYVMLAATVAAIG